MESGDIKPKSTVRVHPRQVIPGESPTHNSRPFDVGGDSPDPRNLLPKVPASLKYVLVCILFKLKQASSDQDASIALKHACGQLNEKKIDVASATGMLPNQGSVCWDETVLSGLLGHLMHEYRMTD